MASLCLCSFQGQAVGSPPCHRPWAWHGELNGLPEPFWTNSADQNHEQEPQSTKTLRVVSFPAAPSCLQIPMHGVRLATIWCRALLLAGPAYLDHVAKQSQITAVVQDVRTGDPPRSPITHCVKGFRGLGCVMRMAGNTFVPPSALPWGGRLKIGLALSGSINHGPPLN